MTLWRETDHPRDGRGRFAETAGGGWVDQALFQLNLGPEADLLDLVRYGQVTDREELAGGNSAQTELVHYSRPNATVGMAVRKRSNADDSRMEVWASQIGRAIGAPVPVVVHDPDDDRVVHMEYVDGTSVHELIEDQDYDDDFELPEQKYLDEWVNTPDGVMLGVLDMLIGNRDRHPGNWLIRDDDNGIVGIDHGSSWADVHHDIRGITAEQEEEQGYPWQPWTSSPFVENLTQNGGLPPWMDQRVIEEAGRNLHRLVASGVLPERMGKRLLSRWGGIVGGGIFEPLA